MEKFGENGECRRRRQAADFARASVGLEGFKLIQADEVLTERFVNGEMDLKEALTPMALPDHLESSERDERIEGYFCYWRILELELDPVRGDFDAVHLREINRRIFQDLPRMGLADVTPGQYRPAVPDGMDWVKYRVLSSVTLSYFVAYSRMDEAAQRRLDEALADVAPQRWREMKTEDFAGDLARLYVELDYIHPFGDGNSRTLRAFTRQLARECGYGLAWEKLYANEAGRDTLYVARDLSVYELARPQVQHQETMQKLVYGMDRLEGNRTLPELLRDLVSAGS